MSAASRKEVHIKIAVNDDTLANKLIHAFNSNDPIDILGSNVKVGCIDYKKELGGANVLAAIGGEMMKLNAESDEMTTYNSYEAAKIASTDKEIIRFDKQNEFKAVGGDELSAYLTTWTKCNPADYCMTVEQFLTDGHKFVDGDLILDEGSVYLVADCKTQNHWYETESANEPDCDDDRRFILRAAALEEKPKRIKAEYVKCEYGDKVSNIVMDFENDAPLYKMVNDEYWTIDELDDLFHLILNDCHIYRKVETEIEWWDGIANYLKSEHDIDTSFDSGYLSMNAKEGVIGVGLDEEGWKNLAKAILEGE